MKKTFNKSKKERIVMFDVIRGLFIVLVMIDHFFFDMYGVYKNEFQSEFFISLADFSIKYYKSLYRTIIRPIGLLAFFMISGILTDFSCSNLKRCIKYGIIALLIFVVTYLYHIITGETNCVITIGVMYVFTVCAFIGWLCKRFNIPSIILIIVGLIFSVVGNLYYFGVTDYLTDKLFFLFYNLEVGINYSADYFPLLPYTGYFILGIVVSRVFYKEKKPHLPLSNGMKKVLSPLSFLGRTSIFWYLLSQVLFIGFFEVCLYFGG